MSDEKFLTRWALLRHLGMWDFILHRGILGLGVLFSILTVAMDVVLNHPLEGRVLAIRLPVQVFLGGLIFGYASWWNSEKKYWR
jgi:hypothetical protein